MLLILHDMYACRISSGDFLEVYLGEGGSCSFQHLLYWLTQVPRLSDVLCRSSTSGPGSSTLITIPIHCPN